MGLIANILLAKRQAQERAAQLEAANNQLVQKVDELERTLSSPDIIVLDDADKKALLDERE